MQRQGWLLLLLILLSSQIACAQQESASSENIHAQLYRDNRFPSAKLCKTCHEEHYRQWQS